MNIVIKFLEREIKRKEKLLKKVDDKIEAKNSAPAEIVKIVKKLKKLNVQEELIYKNDKLKQLRRHLKIDRYKEEEKKEYILLEILYLKNAIKDYNRK